MQNETLIKTRKAYSDFKNQNKFAQASDKAFSPFEDILQAQLVSFQRVNFSDIVIYEQESLSSLACYLCNESTFVVINVDVHPDFVNKWKIKNYGLADKIENAIVFFEKGSHGVSEVLLSRYEIEKRRV